MLATMVPLFDENTAVKAYSVFVQKQSHLLNPSMIGTGYLDGAGNILGLEVVNSTGIGTLNDDQVIFVEISKISMFSAVDEMCEVPMNRVVLLADKHVPAEQMYVDRLAELKDMGFKLAMKGLKVTQFEEYSPILKLLDYITLDYQKLNMAAAKTFFSKVYPNIKLIAVNVNTTDEFSNLANGGAYSLYEGEFYRIPVTRGSKEISPLKVNYIELLNVVNKPDFELTQAADVIGRDTAMVVELLRVVNRMSRNSEITSIRHAAAMLGQKELKKWINAIVTNQLCTDKPNELTRLSLLRAKFSENLAQVFSLASNAQELFLMGLFSVLDIILDKPIAEALNMVNVSKPIKDALINNTGDMAKVFNFVLSYESASWGEISRVMLLEGINEKVVYDAYLDSLEWYRDLFGDKATGK